MDAHDAYALRRRLAGELADSQLFGWSTPDGARRWHRRARRLARLAKLPIETVLAELAADAEALNGP